MALKLKSNQEPAKVVRSVFMGRERIDNTLYFESDEDFERFVFRPYAQTIRTESGTLTVQCDYSDEYKQCIAQGIEFEIKDEESKVAKRQCATLRVPVRELDGNLLERDTLVQLNVKVNDFDCSLYEELLKSATEQ